MNALYQSMAYGSHGFRPAQFRSALESPDIDVPHAGELLLSIVLGDVGKPVRDAAKKWIKTHGSAAVQQALKLKSRKRYTKPKCDATIVEDLEELSAIDGFSAHIFAKYVYMKAKYIPSAYTYFLQRASHEDLVFHLREDFWRNGSVELDSTQLEMSPPMLAAFLEAIADEALAQCVTVLCFGTSEDVVFPQGSFQHLRNVRRVVIDAQHLTTFPEEVTSFYELRHLQIEGGDIVKRPRPQSPMKTIPSTIGALRNLNVLHLESLSIAELPKEIGNLTALQKLQIADNDYLRVLPEEISNCSGLTDLRIKGTRNIIDFPFQILNLPLYDSYKQAIEDIYMTDDPYAVVVRTCRPMTRFTFKNVASVQNVWSRYDKSKDAEKAQVPELLLAFAKCYFDGEHDDYESNRGSNAFIHQTLGQEGPDALGQAIRLIAKPMFFTREADRGVVKKMAALLDDKTPFSGSAFTAFVEAMLEVDQVC